MSMKTITTKSSEVKKFTGKELGHLIYHGQISFLVGRICTLVESLGLKDTQEKAVKDLIKNEIYHNIESTEMGGRILSETVHNTLREFLEIESEDAQKNNIVGGIHNGTLTITFERNAE